MHRNESFFYFFVFLDDFMEFGANCEQMAVDIEDHILQFWD